MRTHVHLVRLSVFICLFTFTFSQSRAQSISTGDGKFEIGLGLGPMFFLGDLGGSAGTGKTFIKDLDFPLTKLNKGLFVNYYPTEWLGFRLAANMGAVEGDDALAPNKGGAERFRQIRNLNFRSKISEAYVAAEIYPTVFLEKYDGLQGKLRPYGLIGVGLMKFNPKAKDASGQYVALQPLHLEGQGMAEYPDRKEYKLLQQEIPMGLGFKYFVKENMYIGMEVLHRKLFTDYVDDVSTGYIDPALFDAYLPAAQAAQAQSLYYRGTYAQPNQNPGIIQTFQRGDPNDKDAYFSTIIRFGWKLNDNNDPGVRARKQLRCPVFY